MGRAKAGRKRKAGERYPSGALKSVIDRGNDRRQAQDARFSPFQGGKAGQWVSESAIGRAWAVGLLDGFDVDAAALRDAGLNYAARYWGEYPTNASVSNYEGEDRRGRSGGSPLDRDRRGEIFARLDEAVRDAGREARQALHEMVIDHHWFPECNPGWLDRLINGELVKRKLPVAGMLPMPGDWDRLRLAVSGLLTIAAGKRRAA